MPSSTVPFRSLIRTLAATLLSFSAISSAQAGLIWNPSTIVDHGSYITDTANKRDWYKFNNPVNTVGWSMNGWMQAYGNNGWSVASDVQVNGLKSQYGWVIDTPDSKISNTNLGLTSAMGEDLGFTLKWFGGLDHELGANFLEAMTSSAGSLVDPVTGTVTAYSGISSLRTYTYDTGSGMVYYGDDVASELRWQDKSLGQGDTGIWLSRASADVIVDVPEPGSAPLMLLGLGGLIALRASRSWALKRQHATRAS